MINYDNMKNFFFQLFLIVAAVYIALCPHAQAMKIITEFVVPQRVSVFLSSSIEGNDRIPTLLLSADAGGGCDSASALKTKESLNGSNLVVDIEGYELTKGSGEVCIGVVQESRTKVNIDADWLKKPGDKEIIFRLRGQENRYKITYSQYQVTLSGIQATNVLTCEFGTNFPDTPVNLEVVLYPPDVAVLYLAGSVSSDQDYRAALNDFAQAKGFLPADQIYDGLQQTERNQFYVVGKSRALPEPGHADSLGELPGEPGTGVYLKQISGLYF